jgi:hypothetical protein
MSWKKSLTFSILTLAGVDLLRAQLWAVKTGKEQLFQAHQKAAFFWSLLTLSEHVFPFTEELSWGYEMPSKIMSKSFSV